MKRVPFRYSQMHLFCIVFSSLLTLCFIFSSGHCSTTSRTSSSTCARVKQSTTNLLGIGLSKHNHLWLATAEWLLYDLLLHNDHLYLGEAIPLGLQDKLPNLPSAGQVHPSLRSPHSSLSMCHQQQNRDLFVLRALSSSKSTFELSLAPNNQSEVAMSVLPSEHVCIPSSNESIFYTFDASNNQSMLHVWQHSSKGNTTQLTGLARPLCAVNPDAIGSVSHSSSSPCHSVRWPVQSGFMLHDRFYLFGADSQVYIFDKSVLNTGSDDPPVKVNIIPLGQFLKCNETQTFTTEVGNKAAFVICMVLLGLIVVILFLVCVVIPLCKEDPNEQPTEKPKKAMSMQTMLPSMKQNRLAGVKRVTLSASFSKGKQTAKLNSNQTKQESINSWSTSGKHSKKLNSHKKTFKESVSRLKQTTDNKQVYGKRKRKRWLEWNGPKSKASSS